MDGEPVRFPGIRTGGNFAYRFAEISVIQPIVARLSRTSAARGIGFR
jgi:hypothetical protein